MSLLTVFLSNVWHKFDLIICFSLGPSRFEEFLDFTAKHDLYKDALLFCREDPFSFKVTAYFWIYIVNTMISLISLFFDCFLYLYLNFN